MSPRTAALDRPRREQDFFRRFESLLLIVVVFVAILPFFGLDRRDLDKDEGMWALRARAIVDHGVWMDQTQYSINGLYSSAYPPLVTWAQAAAMNVFGPTPAAARLPGAIFGFATVIIIFYMARKIYGFRAAVFAAIVFGLSHQSIEIAQTAKMDIPYVFFVTLAIYLYMRYQRGSGRALAILPLAGVATGMAFMCKPVLGLYVPLVIAPWLLVMVLWQRYGWKRAVIDMLWLALGVIAVASWWHFYMGGRYPGTATEAGFWSTLIGRNIIDRAATAFEGHSSGWGWLYYINALVNHYPFVFCLGIIALAETTRTLWHKVRPRQIGFGGVPRPGGADRTLLSIDDRLRLLVLFWLVVAFLVPTAFSSKLTRYGLMAAVPFAILCGSAIDRVYRGATSRETNVGLFAWTVTVIVYWQTHRAQHALEAIVGGGIPGLHTLNAGELAVLIDGGARALLVVASAGLGTFALAFSAWSLRHRFLARHESVGRMVIPLIVMPMMLVTVIRVAIGPRYDPDGDAPHPRAAETAFHSAAQRAAALGIEPVELADHLIVLGHWEDNFQMAFYTGGASSGIDWRVAPGQSPPEPSEMPRFMRIESEDGVWQRRDAGHEQDPTEVADFVREVESLLLWTREKERSLAVILVMSDPELRHEAAKVEALVGHLENAYDATALYRDLHGHEFSIFILDRARKH